MATARKQFCFNCGEELGTYAAYPGDIQVCGKAECCREEREQYRAEREDRQYAAEQDDCAAYGNRRF